jgi:PPOX class probable F420-dependent enzyme
MMRISVEGEDPNGPPSTGVEDPLEHLRRAKTVMLSTYKRDGTAIRTPVSIAFDADRAFFRSYDTAWKTKRLRNRPRVELAPSTFRGNVTGPTVSAQARLLTDGEADVAAKALARRHRILQRVIVPIAHRLLGYRTIHYELILR